LGSEIQRGLGRTAVSLTEVVSEWWGVFVRSKLFVSPFILVMCHVYWALLPKWFCSPGVSFSFLFLSHGTWSMLHMVLFFVTYSRRLFPQSHFIRVNARAGTREGVIHPFLSRSEDPVQQPTGRVITVGSPARNARAKADRWTGVNMPFLASSGVSWYARYLPTSYFLHI